MPADPNRGPRHSWAVCPRIEDFSRLPHLFETEIEAKEFLKAEVPLPDPQIEAAEWCITVEEVLRRREEGALIKAAVWADAERLGISIDEWLQRKRNEPDEAQLRSEAPNGLDFRQIAAHWKGHQFKVIRNQDHGWFAPVPVRNVVAHPGPSCQSSFREFLPISAVGAVPAQNMSDLLDRVLEERWPDFICNLDDDWRFSEIARDSWGRVGHEFEGRKHASVEEIVVKGIYDLEDSVRRLHGALSIEALNDFWRSWDIQRHIATLCLKVEQSAAAKVICRSDWQAQQKANGTRDWILAQIAAFAKGLKAGDEPTIEKAALVVLNWSDEVHYHVNPNAESSGTSPSARTTERTSAETGEIADSAPANDHARMPADTGLDEALESRASASANLPPENPALLVDGSLQEDSIPAPGMVPSGPKPDPSVAHASAKKGSMQRGRRKDFKKSRERLALCEKLASELATLKQELVGYCTVEQWKRKHPNFTLWNLIDDSQAKALADGEDFTPKAYAASLALAKFGVTSRETLKKDRSKLRKAGATDKT